MQLSISFTSKEIQIKDDLLIQSSNSLIDAIPSEFINFLQERNIDLRILGDWKFLTEYQKFIYLPLISLGTTQLKQSLKLVLSLIKEFLEKLRYNSEIIYFGYNLELPFEGNTMIFSLLGKKENVYRWLNNEISLIEYEEGKIKFWIKSAANFIYSNFKIENGYSPIAEILKPSGVLYYNNQH